MEFTHKRGKRQDDSGLGSVLDVLLANARLVLGVSGAAVLAIATLAVKRVRLAAALGLGLPGLPSSLAAARGDGLRGCSLSVSSLRPRLGGSGGCVPSRKVSEAWFPFGYLNVFPLKICR